jgi:murein L,D-transpeptidase YcbB/YkuD
MFRIKPMPCLRTLLWMVCCAMFVGQADSAGDAAPGAMRHYALLEQALPKYRQLAREPQLTELPALPGRSVRAGEPYAGAGELRKLLQAVGDMPAQEAGNEELTLDAPLVAALKRFQERHGLEQDGTLGTETWRALTTPMAARVRQIEVTLARWRSLPPNPHQRAIFINVPRFRLYAMNSGDDRESAMLQMDTVVGRNVKHLRTPVFHADLTHIVFRPYWDVPLNIAVNEILPAARKDPAYFEREDYELVNSSGSVVPFSRRKLKEVASGSLRIRQRPGVQNALGKVKFMMPNPYDVYLHDTPEQHLFERTARAFSHGCIRLAQPAAMAEWLLENDPEWNAERIASAMNGAKPVQVNLAVPVRVYIVYATAIAREDGTVLFLSDVYGIDRQEMS